jgi:hypothetical protein
MNECKFCDDFTGVCVNPECPMRGDCCPVPDTEGVCKFECREVEEFKMTPKGCAYSALQAAGLVQWPDDPAVEVFWNSFHSQMVQLGYAVEGA